MARRSGSKRNAQQSTEEQQATGVFYQTRSKKQRTGEKDNSADNG